MFESVFKVKTFFKMKTFSFINHLQSENVF